MFFHPCVYLWLNMTVRITHLCPWAAARLYEFMSPCGAVEMPLRYMVPTMGSAPLSSSKLTSSKLPVHEKQLAQFKYRKHPIRLSREKDNNKNHLSCICLYFNSFQEDYDSKAMSYPATTLTVRCCHQLVKDGQLVLSAWHTKAGQVEANGGVTVFLCTCSSSQLQRGLCVVLHPFLQGPLYVGFGIQQ